MKYISIISVQIYFSLLVSIKIPLGSSSVGFGWSPDGAMQIPDGLQLDDPEIYMFGCIQGGLHLDSTCSQTGVCGGV